jgi:arylsulfatase A-like enzyme
MSKHLKLERILKLLCIAFILMSLSCSNEKGNESNKTGSQDEAQNQKPNVLLIYMDDLGYGDLNVYGGVDLDTPNIDKLAEEGVKFTDGYATSATCTPSRFGILTGMYPWRSKKAKILSGSAPMLIDTTQMTIAKMLKSQGYETGIVGKWHLGLGSGNVDWNKHISPGPNEVGFDYSYIMAATQDRVPTVYIEDGHVVNLNPDDPIEVNYRNNFEGEPTGKENPELLRLMWHHGHNNSIINGIPRLGYMKGGHTARWNDETMSDEFLMKAKDYIKSKKDEPFFLYYAMQQPHVPRTPSPRFLGKSGMGPRGDVILEADWNVGEIMKTLEDEGVLENTLVIFTSDNGPVLNDGYYDDAVEKLGNHKPGGPFRGGKYSLFEAGTRVPFITYWKGKIEPKVSEALVSQVDLLTSLAKLVGSDVRGQDSEDLLDVFLGKSDEGREELIIEATTRTAFRKNNWVMIPPYDGVEIIKPVNIETGNSEGFQLYDLDQDLGQQRNLAEQYPEKLEKMIKAFENIRGKDYSEIEKPMFKQKNQ